CSILFPYTTLFRSHLLFLSIHLVAILGPPKYACHRSLQLHRILFLIRSEERRVGKECRSPWGPRHYEEKKAPAVTEVAKELLEEGIQVKETRVTPSGAERRTA